MAKAIKLRHRHHGSRSIFPRIIHVLVLIFKKKSAKPKTTEDEISLALFTTVNQFTFTRDPLNYINNFNILSD
jgi:hypothetical protein